MAHRRPLVPRRVVSGRKLHSLVLAA